MVIFWLVLGILPPYSELQTVSNAIDYQYVSLHEGPSRNEVGKLESRQTTVNFLSCRVVHKQICPDPDVKFFLYTKSNPENPQFVRISADPTVSNLKETAYNSSKPSKIIIHGYNSDMNIAVLVEIRKEYLKTQDYNIFTVDWSPLNQAPCYLGALVNIRHVGACSAQLVQRLRETGAKDIHVIGFSLGAHITNFMAVALRPYILPRITGLDPALPGFVTPVQDDKLDSSDATFVDVYHTNAFIQGVVETSGHVDFYINGGVLQPGCWTENRFFACNHHRAPLYFAESINSEKGFWGWSCDSFWQFITGGCLPREPLVLMGERVDPKLRGVYLVITESVSPYAVGKYVGSNVEIYFKSNQQRLTLLEDYKEKLSKFIDIDDMIDNVNSDNTIQAEVNLQLAYDTFQFSGEDSEDVPLV